MTEEYPYLERYLVQFAPYSITALQAMVANGCIAFNELVRPSALLACKQLLAEQQASWPEEELITARTALEMEATKELAAETGLSYEAARQLAAEMGITPAALPTGWKYALAVAGLIGGGAALYYLGKKK